MPCTMDTNGLVLEIQLEKECMVGFLNDSLAPLGRPGIEDE